MKRSAKISDVEREARALAARLDTSKMAVNFGRFAGADQLMQRDEFDRFTKITNLTRQQANSLWIVLDRDGSGEVTKEEFTTALENFQKARAWLRFCPSCVYANTCNYCQECNSNCEMCTEHSFCAEHWNDHPARNQSVGEAGTGSAGTGAPANTTELLRERLVIRPLEWMYESPLTAWLPVEQKGALRRVLRAQQTAANAAAERAREEEEKANKARQHGSGYNL